MRHAPWPFSRWQRQRSGTAESRQNAYECLTLGLFRPGDRGGRRELSPRDRSARQGRCGQARAAKSSGRATAPSVGLEQGLLSPGRRHRRSRRRAPERRRRDTLPRPAQRPRCRLLCRRPGRDRSACVRKEVLARSVSASASMRACAVAAFDSATSITPSGDRLSFRPSSFGAAEIMREEIALRPLLELADGSDQEPHSCSP